MGIDAQPQRKFLLSQNHDSRGKTGTRPTEATGALRRKQVSALDLVLSEYGHCFSGTRTLTN
ncbi:hypothetical protein V1278_002522 [Bradyrhizobium sp. AZCC 1577]